MNIKVNISTGATMSKKGVIVEERTSLRNQINDLMSHHGNFIEVLPELHRLVRVSSIGYTLPTQPTTILPTDIEDIYIGRLRNPNGNWSADRFFIYREQMLNGKRIYFYISTDSVGDYNAEVLLTFYTYVANQRNWHALWFRSIVQDYQEKHSNWDSNAKQSSQDLRRDFESLLHLGKVSRIPRFVIELEETQSFWKAIGLAKADSQTVYDYVY